jgi:hypothetical protein
MNNPNCSDDKDYIMATSKKIGNVFNSFYFSQCSLGALKENIITKRKFECVFNQATNYDDYKQITSFIPGQLYDSDEQCKLIYGENTRSL